MRATEKLKKEFAKHRKGIICVHDELLFALYNAIPDEIEEEVINGEHYLVVKRYVTAKTGVHLMAKIPSELLIKDGEICNYEDLELFRREKIKEKLKEKLCFSVQEIYLLNILLDNFIGNKSTEIKLSDIHCFYRDKKFEKNHKIDVLTLLSYMRALVSLAEKEIYCITDKAFRKMQYGVNNKQFYGTLLEIMKFKPRDDKGDAYIKYSLGEFGNIIKKSKRYSSDILPNEVFTYKFRSNKKYILAMQIARIIFINRLNKKSYDISRGIKMKVKQMLDEIPSFDGKGHNKNITLLEKIYSNKYNYKIQQINQLISYIEMNLEMFEKYGVVSSFYINTKNKFTSLREFEKLEIEIVLSVHQCNNLRV